MREFVSGATRDTDNTKPDPEGCFHPLVLKAVSDYMAKHSYLPNGTRRAADNWMKGMPRAVWRKSLERHWLDVKLHDKSFSDQAREPMIDALCAVIFNAQGRLLEELLGRDLPLPKEQRLSTAPKVSQGVLEEIFAETLKEWGKRVDRDIMALVKNPPKKRKRTKR